MARERGPTVGDLLRFQPKNPSLTECRYIFGSLTYVFILRDGMLGIYLGVGRHLLNDNCHVIMLPDGTLIADHYMTEWAVLSGDLPG